MIIIKINLLLLFLTLTFSSQATVIAGPEDMKRSCLSSARPQGNHFGIRQDYNSCMIDYLNSFNGLTPTYDGRRFFSQLDGIKPFPYSRGSQSVYGLASRRSSFYDNTPYFYGPPRDYFYGRSLGL